MEKRIWITGVGKGIGYFVVYIILMMIFQSLFSILFMAIEASHGIKSENLLIKFAHDNMLLCVLLSNVCILTIFFIIYKLRKRSVAKDWKLNPFSWQEVFFASLSTLSFSIFFTWISSLLGNTEPNLIIGWAHYYSSIFPGLGLIILCLNIIIMAPLVEEVVMRGVIYNQIEKTTNPLTAIIVSAVLFGLLHFMAGGVTLVIGATGMGLILGYIYYKTNSLWVCIMAHSIANMPDIYLFLQ